MIAFASPKMSLLIHESMVSNLLFSSLNEFFDRVPLGRIFNRLSKDLNSVDSNLPTYFSSTIVFMFFLTSNLLVIFVIAPIYIFLPAIIIYLIFCHILRSYCAIPQRELTRIEGVTKSPIVSCFTEILSGVTTIRCYNVKDMFFHKNCEKINENKKPIIARKAAEVWFTFRLTVLSLIISLTSLTYILFFTTKEANATDAAAKAGLLLLCSLGIDEIMYFLYVNLNTFENELISIERC
jgi:ABC-type multidrug transport system fused ATPase/permease subunit